MTFTTRDVQSRVSALGFPLKIDGMNGSATRAAVNEAKRALGVRKTSHLFHRSGIHGIIWHWTAGRDVPTQDDCSHYNDVFDHEGNHYDGGARIETQASYDWRKDIGVSHTKNANTGRGGLAVAGMYNAEGWPMKWGTNPITWEGIDAMLERTAYYNRKFNIPVTPWSNLSHAEVEQTLGIKQRAKWDFMVLPGSDAPESAIKIGNILRSRLIERFM